MPPPPLRTSFMDGSLGAAVRGVRGVLAGRLRALRSMQGKIHNNMSAFAILAYVLEYFMSS